MMKNLKDLLYTVAIKERHGSTDRMISTITMDSRTVENNAVFVAVKGVVVDGHTYINKAVAMGAAAIICEELPTEIHPSITYIQVENSAIALGIIAGNYYDNPSQKLQLVGITGTNGKTTTATLLYQMFQNLGYKTALLSTIAIKFGTEEIPATHTTPDVITINKYLSQAVELGCSYAFMEVSSHGIDQNRIAGLQFVGGIFSNLTHDHLDYHKTFKEYLEAKKKFFDNLPKSAFALTNLDDKNGSIMLQNTIAKKYTYALKTMADFKGKVLESRLDGTLIQLNGKEVWSQLVGTFNVYNLLVVYAIAQLLKQNEFESLTAISKLTNVKGRFQTHVSEKGLVTIIDYAHTPDALKNVLETINQLRTGNEQLITIVGCGGDRDTSKRPIMAAISCEYSSQVIFTADNPRSEDPQEIIHEMETGVPAQYYNKTLSILDRKEAIKTAIKMAQPNDIILIAGKGHETYQEIKGKRTDFDDFAISQEMIQLLQK